MQYKLKNFNLLLFTNLNISLHAKIPVIKAAIKPIARELKLGELINIFSSKRILAMLPRISGITIKKEKFAAFSRLIPRNIASAIVAPLREIPGIIATACINPMKNALL